MRHVGRRRAGRFLPRDPTSSRRRCGAGWCPRCSPPKRPEPVRRPAGRRAGARWSPNGPQRRCPTPSLRSDWWRCVELPRRRLADVLGRRAAAGRRRGGDLRTRQRGHADPHRRCDGRRRRGAGRSQRRSLQRQMPAGLGGQHLRAARGRRTRRRRVVAALRDAGLQVLATTRRRRGRPGRRRPRRADGVAVRAGGTRPADRISAAWPTTGYASRCPAAPRASTSLRPRRSASTRARGRSGGRRTLQEGRDGAARPQPRCSFDDGARP